MKYLFDFPTRLPNSFQSTILGSSYNPEWFLAIHFAHCSFTYNTELNCNSYKWVYINLLEGTDNF